MLLPTLDVPHSPRNLQFERLVPEFKHNLHRVCQVPPGTSPVFSFTWHKRWTWPILNSKGRQRRARRRCRQKMTRPLFFLMMAMELAQGPLTTCTVACLTRCSLTISLWNHMFLVRKLEREMRGKSAELFTLEPHARKVVAELLIFKQWRKNSEENACPLRTRQKRPWLFLPRAQKDFNPTRAVKVCLIDAPKKVAGRLDALIHLAAGFGPFYL